MSQQASWVGRVKDITHDLVGQINPDGIPIGLGIDLLMDIFWPKDEPSVWDEVKDQVNAQIDKKILSHEIEIIGSKLTHIREQLGRYSEYSREEKPNYPKLAGILSTLLDDSGAVYTRIETSKTNRIHFIPLLVTLAPLQLTILREQFLYGDKLYGPDKHYKEDLESSYTNYKNLIDELYSEWKTWRSSQITIKYKTDDHWVALDDHHATIHDLVSGREIKLYEETDTKNVLHKPAEDVKLMFERQATADMAHILNPTFYLHNFLPDSKFPINEPNYSHGLDQLEMGPYATGSPRPPNVTNKTPDRIKDFYIRHGNNIDGMKVIYDNHEGEFVGQMNGRPTTLDGSGSEVYVNGLNLSFLESLETIQVAYSDGSTSENLGNDEHLPEKSLSMYKGIAQGYELRSVDYVARDRIYQLDLKFQCRKWSKDVQMTSIGWVEDITTAPFPSPIRINNVPVDSPKAPTSALPSIQVTILAPGGGQVLLHKYFTGTGSDAEASTALWNEMHTYVHNRFDYPGNLMFLTLQGFRAVGFPPTEISTWLESAGAGEGLEKWTKKGINEYGPIAYALAGRFGMKKGDGLEEWGGRYINTNAYQADLKVRISGNGVLTKVSGDEKRTPRIFREVPYPASGYTGLAISNGGPSLPNGKVMVIVDNVEGDGYLGIAPIGGPPSWGSWGGRAKKVASDPLGHVWIIDRADTVARSYYGYDVSNWTTHPLEGIEAKELSVSWNGAIFAIEKDSGHLFRWSQSTYDWQKPGEWTLFDNTSADKVSVDHAGNPWILRDEQIFKFDSGSWKKVAGAALEIAVSASGVYIIGLENEVRMLASDGQSWTPLGVAAKAIAADDNGFLFIIDENGDVQTTYGPFGS